VDDMILARNIDQEIVQAHHDSFRIKDLGELWIFLGFEVAWTKRYADEPPIICIGITK